MGNVWRDGGRRLDLYQHGGSECARDTSDCPAALRNPGSESFRSPSAWNTRNPAAGQSRRRLPSGRRQGKRTRRETQPSADCGRGSRALRPRGIALHGYSVTMRPPSHKSCSLDSSSYENRSHAPATPALPRQRVRRPPRVSCARRMARMARGGGGHGGGGGGGRAHGATSLSARAESFAQRDAFREARGEVGVENFLLRDGVVVFDAVE